MAFNIPWSSGAATSSGGGGGGAPGATLSTISPTDSVVSGAGSTTASLQQISVANIGGANGTWNGQTLLAGMSIVYTAYYDPNANDFKKIAAIAYDATGTTFWISETP